MSVLLEGKFCGFVWFVVPKLLINQKYRVRRAFSREQDIEGEGEKNEESDE